MIARIFRAVILCLVVSLAGCASSVKREDLPGTAVLSKDTKFSEVKLVLSEEATKLLVDNTNFSTETMRGKLVQYFEAKGMIVANAPARLEVEITDIRTRSTFSAVMWGFMAGSDRIGGNVYVKNSDGAPISKFSVSASYALGGFAGGQEGMRMNWLYDEFIKQTANELTGEGKK